MGAATMVEVAKVMVVAARVVVARVMMEMARLMAAAEMWGEADGTAKAQSRERCSRCCSTRSQPA